MNECIRDPIGAIKSPPSTPGCIAARAVGGPYQYDETGSESALIRRVIVNLVLPLGRDDNNDTTLIPSFTQ